MSALNWISSKLFAGDTVYARHTYGGIRPQSFKQHSLRSRIMSTPIPAQLTIPVGAADGGTITQLVAVGEQVLKYQKLASIQLNRDGCSEVFAHAPTSGVIAEIKSARVADHRIQQQLCLLLTTDGHDDALVVEPSYDPVNLNSAEIVDIIREAGIIGMGGAGFPSADKLDSAFNSAIDILIINATECEPYITADESLIRERAKKTVLGAELLQRACSATRCVFAIEESKRDAIEALTKALQADTEVASSCELVIIPTKYPAGSENLLIHCVTGIEVPSGEYPAQSGVLMLNSGTAYAVCEAVVQGKPCISRITTLCGETLQTPKNFEVLIGTSANFLFDLCGIDNSVAHRSIVGGPLMGRELNADDAVIYKTTNCLIAAGPADIPMPAEERACIRCGFCADVCPVRLLPQQLLAFSKSSDTDALVEHGLFDCIECGACDYVCPSHIALVSTYKDSKACIEARQQEVDRSAYWQQRFQYRQYRLKKDKDQSLARKSANKTPAPKLEKKATPAPLPNGQDFFSKEKASAEIAAAVARVKARREAKTRVNGESHAAPKDDPK
ncbi:MAG: electron transport complex subunit RsxC [Pseudohongiellaceae bacterium]